MSAKVDYLQPKIKGTSLLLAILGDPVTKVKSTDMVNQALFDAGIDAILVPLHVSSFGLGQAMQSLRVVENLKGVIITTPHKNAVIPFLDEMDRSVQIIGSCNLIKKTTEGRLVGAVGDGEGFIRGLKAQNRSVNDKDVYLVGAGPAASAMAFAIAKSGAKRLTLANRTTEKAVKLAQGVSQIFPSLEVNVDLNGDIRGYDVVVNGTSLGMQDDDPLPLDVSQLQAGTLVAEVIGTPDKTPLLLEAEARGCEIHYGSHVLAGQIELILEFLLGANPDVE